LRKLECPRTDTELRKNIATVLDEVSNKLGNSRNICKKYYVHPSLLQLYEQDKLKDLLCSPGIPGLGGLNADEKILMEALKKSL
jgi:DNA topoisomerase-1